MAKHQCFADHVSHYHNTGKWDGEQALATARREFDRSYYEAGLIPGADGRNRRNEASRLYKHAQRTAHQINAHTGQDKRTMRQKLEHRNGRLDEGKSRAMRIIKETAEAALMVHLQEWTRRGNTSNSSSAVGHPQNIKYKKGSRKTVAASTRTRKGLGAVVKAERKALQIKTKAAHDASARRNATHQAEIVRQRAQAVRV